MHITIGLLFALLVVSTWAQEPVATPGGQSASAPKQGAIPEPNSWSFPAVVESARAIASRNVEGREFDRFGLAYSLPELQAVRVGRLPAQDLQRYADIVVHAYPDAVFRQITTSCSQAPVESLNTGAVAGVAYVSLHAIDPATRQKAAECLAEIQTRLKSQQPAR